MSDGPEETLTPALEYRLPCCPPAARSTHPRRFGGHLFSPSRRFHKRAVLFHDPSAAFTRHTRFDFWAPLFVLPSSSPGSPPSIDHVSIPALKTLAAILSVMGWCRRSRLWQSESRILLPPISVCS